MTSCAQMQTSWRVKWLRSRRRRQHKLSRCDAALLSTEWCGNGMLCLVA
jgi:hypothetical protein